MFYTPSRYAIIEYTIKMNVSKKIIAMITR